MHRLLGWPGPVTYRQYLVWMEWLRRQWNEPSRSDHYAMQVGAIQAGEKDLGKLKLKFGSSNSSAGNAPWVTKAKIAEWEAIAAKAKWGLLASGGKPTPQVQHMARKQEQNSNVPVGK